jgi:hypothetical protein
LTTVTRPSSFLLVLILLIITVAGVQESLVYSSEETTLQSSTNIANKSAGHDILRKYYAVSALSLGEAKAFFSNAAANEKSELWRIHLALFLVKHPELNESQKEIVLAAMSLTTPEFFETRSTDSSWKTKVGVRLRSLEQRIHAAFSSADAARIFATLGDDTEVTNDIADCAGPVLLKSVSYELPGDNNSYKAWTYLGIAGQSKDKQREKERDKGKSQGKQTESGNAASSCTCSQESDYCPVRTSCVAGGCQKLSSGCGTFWIYACDGSCQ